MKLVTLTFVLGIVLTVVTPTMTAAARKVIVPVTYYNTARQENEFGIYYTGDCMAIFRSPTSRVSSFKVNTSKSECHYYEDSSCSKKAAMPPEELDLRRHSLRFPDSPEAPLSFKCFAKD
ncbi:hypothetical protein BCR42DRAFT_444268 [Absidia repens]|uniref:Beta/gamma crystallin 'Greek key' domain-containing protein n=1 Tax=Absidia repens TaxID=90262 RepID=A0A1X2HWX8_9FUNG|nr:hypothetical protein BCR42DRAFT_444268 [Absidia repens]